MGKAKETTRKASKTAKVKKTNKDLISESEILLKELKAFGF